MKIEYRVIRNWGIDSKYPVSKDADFVCDLTGLKTLTPWILKLIKESYPTSTFTQVL
jgi:hypothetical protein